MLNVYLTVDMEIWCHGWRDLDRRFPEAFQRYVYGRTPAGDYGLPYLLRQLEQHNLPGVFFVEPLFATRFGLDPLAEVVGLIKEARQEIQLHLHTEWVYESREPLLPAAYPRRDALSLYTRSEQATLIGAGRRWLAEAGGTDIQAFRAGSFACNADTLAAIRDNGISVDSSYNASMLVRNHGIEPHRRIYDPVVLDGLQEHPMTVFDPRLGSLRHAEVVACSTEEMEALLWQAVEQGRPEFVILTHNFECLNQARNRHDPIVAARWENLCAFLDKHRDVFNVRGFNDLEPVTTPLWDEPLSSTPGRTMRRWVQQGVSRSYG
jgi:hypothetical protein